ncbi:Hypothetical predicted protein [Cloeon dipterum]|uniref:RxLR effector protein n=1 Tax=Cloeon dipterum TaxID=197152 RepID=A0A8S1CT66_9INSE|nr:Hypothetical predicted protein [Cloeon dipterum]
MKLLIAVTVAAVCATFLFVAHAQDASASTTVAVAASLSGSTEQVTSATVFFPWLKNRRRIRKMNRLKPMDKEKVDPRATPKYRRAKNDRLTFDQDEVAAPVKSEKMIAQ